MLHRFLPRPVGCGLSLLVLMLLLALNSHVLFRRATGRTPITVSRETTFVSGPLRNDGYVDYFAAVDQEAGAGVKPEENAAVPLLQAMGPATLPEAIRTRYLRRLGLKELPTDEKYFISYAEVRGKDGGQDAAYDALEQALSRPWAAEEFPEVARWLEMNERPMERAIEASRRPKYYTPILAEDEASTLMMLPDAAISAVRELTRALAARAMLRLARGESADACADTLAAARLGRLVSQSPFFVQWLVSIAAEGQTSGLVAAIGHYGDLSPGELARLREDLRARPPLEALAEKFNRGERMSAIDAVTAFARQGPDAFDDESRDGAAEDNPFHSALAALSEAAVNWDETLRVMNHQFDRGIEAISRATRQERLVAVRALDAERGQMLKDTKFSRARKVAAATLSDSARGRFFGDIFASLLQPTISSASNSLDNATAYAALTETSLALAQYRADTDVYPSQLEELVPKYLETVPADPFGTGPLRYKTEGGGYLLYSVGTNEKDDAGRGWASGEEARADRADDLFLRMPVEPSPATANDQP